MTKKGYRKKRLNTLFKQLKPKSMYFIYKLKVGAWVWKQSNYKKTGNAIVSLSHF